MQEWVFERERRLLSCFAYISLTVKRRVKLLRKQLSNERRAACVLACSLPVILLAWLVPFSWHLVLTFALREHLGRGKRECNLLAPCTVGCTQWS